MSKRIAGLLDDASACAPGIEWVLEHGGTAQQLWDACEDPWWLHWVLQETAWYDEDGFCLDPAQREQLHAISSHIGRDPRESVGAYDYRMLTKGELRSARKKADWIRRYHPHPPSVDGWGKRWKQIEGEGE